MKLKSILFLTLVVVGMYAPELQAEKRKPAEDAVMAKESKSDLKKLFGEIKAADLDAVKERMKTVSKELLNEHDGKFSALGLAQHELEQNKRSDLPKAEKTAKTRRLNKIVEQLKEHGATMMYHDGARTARSAKAEA